MKTNILLLLLGAFAVACGPEYDYLSMDLESSPPSAVSLERDRIELPVGIAVAVSVEPVSSAESYDDPDVSLESRDGNFFNVRPGPDPGEFVFIGVAPGATCMEVRVDGHEEECIDVVVTEAERSTD